MVFHPDTVIIILAIIVIASYIFNIISSKTGIPSVLLLILTGLGIKYMSRYYGYVQQDVAFLVRLLGAVGLIMIVLEAALDLKIDRSRLPTIRNSFMSALFVFLASAVSCGLLIMYWFGDVPSVAFLYAVPISIISSAIVIPSTTHLPEKKREFIIYESSFSDIIGILVFNYLLQKDIFSVVSAAHFTWNIILAMGMSLLASVLLLLIISRITTGVKFFLLLAILSLLYAGGEAFHLPSLLIVLVFGLMLNNSGLVMRGKLRHLAGKINIAGVVRQMHAITAETSFLIRTFFFILFGYSIHIKLLLQPEVWKLGSIIVLLLLSVRFLYLKFFLRSNLFPEILLMPRGLVTILLFYSIPAYMVSDNFNAGILFFVVTATSVLMAVGLIFYKKNEPDYIEMKDEL